MESLRKRSFIKISDFSYEEINYLLELAAELKQAKKERREKQFLKDKHIILLFEKDSTRTRSAFEVASSDQGATTTYISPASSPMGKKESMKDTARVLGRMYDGIEYRGFSEKTVEILSEYSGVPVWNGLTDNAHPPQTLADLLTMKEHSRKPLEQIKVCYIGNARNNVTNSLMLGCLTMGMDFRIAAPTIYRPIEEVMEAACKITDTGRGRLTVTDNIAEAVKGCDYLYTDVWLSMGEDETRWDERIRLLEPYRVTRKIMEATGNSHCKFMHCLPAFHNTDTKAGMAIYHKFGIREMEVTDEVFESDASIVFDQAENRMHTIKAVMVATLRNEY